MASLGPYARPHAWQMPCLHAFSYLGLKHHCSIAVRILIDVQNIGRPVSIKTAAPMRIGDVHIFTGHGGMVWVLGHSRSGTALFFVQGQS